MSSKPTAVLLAAVLAGTLLTAGALAQSSPGATAAQPAPGATTAQPAPGAATPAAAAAPGAKALASPIGVPRSQKAARYLALRYGVDHLQVRSVSSGASLEFRYRVLDAEKAKILNDKRSAPYMIDWKTGARLTVPTVEKIGALRQTATPEPGHEYWMVFSNPGKLVKQGDRVDVVAGPVRLEGLIVE
ncbi:MAG TPA: hypothetical protein VN325_15765 [Steroidobacteraceae bacterium]|nr:hypothetical protein [Steroidobacteraceae bacterium]